MRFVIVGNGVAGMEAALAIRAREPEADLAIVSEESDHFFSRTALMYVLAGQMSPQQIEPLERDVYERMRFRRVRARVVGLDAERKEVRLAGELAPLPYDRLILATGSRPRPSPWGRPRGVGHFVTLQDLEWLERELHGGPGRGGRFPNPDAHHAHTPEDGPYAPRDAARDERGGPPKNPVVIGGGLIGVEVVETMLAAGLRPRFLVREEWFWPVALDAREAAWIAERLRGHGVAVELGMNVQAIETDASGSVSGVVTDRGSHPADLVVVAIGVVPNTDFLAGSALERDKGGGIVVEPNLRTSLPDVFACGDCASVLWYDRSRRPEQLWYTARDQGRVAARAALGDAVQYSRGIWYNSAKLMDVEYTTVGLVNQNVDGEASWRFEEAGRVRSSTRIVTGKDGTVVGFNLLGRRWDHTVLQRWIAERRPIAWVVAHLGEAAFDTELVPPLHVPMVGA
jgi:NADPH-dependent 2,4-dienoyl-CoA reductase/sulfur reductase-like enzyme